MINSFLKKNKAQLFSLDIVFALILIMLLLFLLSKISEIKIYKVNNNNNLKEIESVGSQTYKQLILNPKINCYVSDSNNHILLSSCVGNDSQITKENLNIPDSYYCKIENLPAVGINECDDTPVPSENTYKMDLNISYISNTRNISKSTYINNILQGTSLFTDYEITLNVWK